MWPTISDFLIHEEQIVLYFEPKDLIMLSETNKCMKQSINNWLEKNKKTILCQRHMWVSCQKDAWTRAPKGITPNLFWHIDAKRCIFCHKQWYRYARSNYSVPHFAHELCVFKNLERDDTGDIKIPVHLSLFEKEFRNFRLKE